MSLTPGTLRRNFSRYAVASREKFLSTRTLSQTPKAPLVAGYGEYRRWTNWIGNLHGAELSRHALAATNKFEAHVQ